tara:strand:+ start:81 stop:293 length:213 start_codon:yes stop_codon:yes gene_type:complete
MRYESSEVNYKEIVWADLKVIKEIKRGKTIKDKIEELKGVVYKEINSTYKGSRVMDIKVKARLGYENNRK